MADLEELISRLEDSRAKAGISSEKEMLRKAGLNPSRMKPLKRRESAPKIDALIQLARVLDVPLSYLAEPAGINLPEQIKGANDSTADPAPTLLLPPTLDPEIARLMEWMVATLRQGPESYPNALDVAIDLVSSVKRARDSLAAGRPLIRAPRRA